MGLWPNLHGQNYVAITWQCISIHLSHTHTHTHTHTKTHTSSSFSFFSASVIIGQSQPPQAFNEISLKNHKTHVYNKTINLLHLTHKSQTPIFDHSQLLS
ncbi:hypothetical protein Hanom_Chr09g00809571 [Helianthus anomalus]